MNKLKEVYTKWFYNKGYLKPNKENLILQLSYYLLYDKDQYIKCFKDEMKIIENISRKINYDNAFKNE